jgi:hypothetical protein
MKNYTMIQFSLKNWKEERRLSWKLCPPVTKTEYEKALNELK